MIFDLTQTFLQFAKSENNKASHQAQNQEQNSHKVNTNDKFRLPIQYQLTLKVGKDIQNSLLKIQQILAQSKQNYFSNAAYSLNSFSTQQRNQFDETTKKAILDCKIQINQLKQNIDKNMQKNNTYKGHIKEVVLCLYSFHIKIQSQFAEFQKFNQIKKKKILNTLKIKSQKSYQNKPSIEFKPRQQNFDEPLEFKQQLQRQAKQFFLQKIQQQKKIEDTRKTLQGINEVLQLMSNKVLQQQLLTSSFQEIGSIGLNFIDKGNKNLVQANNLSKDSGKYWTILFLALSFSLLFLDFIKS